MKFEIAGFDVEIKKNRQDGPYRNRLRRHVEGPHWVIGAKIESLHDKHVSFTRFQTVNILPDLSVPRAVVSALLEVWKRNKVQKKID